jgi:hypothetical protein
MQVGCHSTGITQIHPSVVRLGPLFGPESTFIEFHIVRRSSKAVIFRWEELGIILKVFLTTTMTPYFMYWNAMVMPLFEVGSKTFPPVDIA